MKITGKRIGKAFKNLTPDIRNTVLSERFHEKGAVIPMTEKKSILPLVLKKIAATAAMIVLLACIGFVGLMILNSGTNPQLSDAPTQPPTDPTEIPDGPASEEKAYAYLRQLVKSPEKYTLGAYYNDTTNNMYHATFVYMINDIPTTDTCTLTMLPDGSLYSIRSYNEGDFENVTVTQDMVLVAEETLCDMYNLDKNACAVIYLSHILWEDGVLSAAFNVQRAEGEFLITRTVPLERYKGTYNEEMAIKWAIKYFGREESEVTHVSAYYGNGSSYPYFEISFRSGINKFYCKIDANTGKVTEERYENAGVFETEDITRITFSGFYGTGLGVNVPEENMGEIIAYLKTFTFVDLAIGEVPPGTDTIHIEIEYADGSAVKHGMNTVDVGGLTYYIQGGTAPECYDNIIADAVLEESQ